MLTEILLAVTDSELESIAKEVYRKAKEAASKGRYWNWEVHPYWHRSIHVILSCCLTIPWTLSLLPANKYLCLRKPKFKLILTQATQFEKLLLIAYSILLALSSIQTVHVYHYRTYTQIFNFDISHLYVKYQNRKSVFFPIIFSFMIHL